MTMVSIMFLVFLEILCLDSEAFKSAAEKVDGESHRNRQPALIDRSWQ
jgi:hypothetical protein